MASGKWKFNSTNQQRGYGAAWLRLRKIILKRDGYLCQCPTCKAEDRVTAASEVDHIRPRAEFIAEALRKGLTEQDGIKASDDPSNLRAVSSRCHRRLTLMQRGYQVDKGFGADGLPIRKDHHWYGCN